jgi:hypothetical protein
MLPPKYNDRLPQVAEKVCADIGGGQYEYQSSKRFAAETQQ